MEKYCKIYTHNYICYFYLDLRENNSTECSDIKPKNGAGNLTNPDEGKNTSTAHLPFEETLQNRTQFEPSFFSRVWDSMKFWENNTNTNNDTTTAHANARYIYFSKPITITSLYVHFNYVSLFCYSVSDNKLPVANPGRLAPEPTKKADSLGKGQQDQETLKNGEEDNKQGEDGTTMTNKTSNLITSLFK